jgi:hypothetical protein
MIAAAGGATLAMPRYLLAAAGRGADAGFGGDLVPRPHRDDKQRSEANGMTDATLSYVMHLYALAAV